MEGAHVPIVHVQQALGACSVSTLFLSQQRTTNKHTN